MYVGKDIINVIENFFRKVIPNFLSDFDSGNDIKAENTKAQSIDSEKIFKTITPYFDKNNNRRFSVSQEERSL